MPTVYALAMYACITVNNLDGLLMSKTCSWHSDGTLCQTETACSETGKGKVSHPYFTDIADGASYEGYHCYPQAVLK